MVVLVKIRFRVVSVNSGVLFKEKTDVLMRKGVENDFFTHKSLPKLSTKIETLNKNTS